MNCHLSGLDRDRPDDSVHADERTVAAGLKQIPLRRFGKPEDIGPLAVYLAVRRVASWVTGQSFVIDGGQIAR